MFKELESSWKKIMSEEFKKDYVKGLDDNIQSAYRLKEVFPPAVNIFTAFSLCPFENVRVVILGQDPYHGLGQAQGLAFSVPDSITIPPSLRNIFKEIYNDLKIPPPMSGNLEYLAKQGVLLLNSTLTVESGKAGSHQGLGWGKFTDAVIEKISTAKTGVVFLLWGTHAFSKLELIDKTKHLVLTAPHPSPLSAYRGFFGCRHFSQTNNYLTKQNIKPIDW